MNCWAFMTSMLSLEAEIENHKKTPITKNQIKHLSDSIA